MENKKTLIFGGDLCINKAKYEIDANVKNTFEEATYAILNLEGPIIDNENNFSKYQKVGTHLLQPVGAIEMLKTLNVKYVSGANNHIFDYGKNGIDHTAELLAKNQITFAGFGKNFYEAQRCINLHNSNISIICATEEEFAVADNNSFGVYSLYNEKIKKQIQELKNDNRYVIIYPHGGGEMIPLPSNFIRNKYRELIDAGADLIVAHHPHIPQGWEQYNDKLIFYSLGNFIHRSFKNSKGLILKIEIEDNKLKKYSCHQIKCEDNKLFFNDSNFYKYIETINNILSDDVLFEALYQEQSINMYKGYYKKYLTGLFVKKDTKTKIKEFIKKNLLKENKNVYIKNEKNDSLNLLHLLRNESHRVFISHALKVLTGEITDVRSNKSKELLKRLDEYIYE